ncbi:MAG: nuclear transport factor 2 family protein [Chitinophagaceae bacterium]|nr:nuclear transport factor 2 family protein [Chitinophagaceae bacterium]
MRLPLTIVLLFSALLAGAQTEEQKLTLTVQEFHQALVQKNTVSLNQHTDKALSYGHSNGWVETKKELLQNLASGFIQYRSYREDSLQVQISGNLAHARFNAEINATLNGSTNTFRLKVLEVWVKKGKRWLLFARQAIKN